MTALAIFNGLAAKNNAGVVNILVSPSVEVRDEVTGALATLYTDRAGTVGLANPFTGTADGAITFYAANGRYQVTATKGADTVTWRNVQVLLEQPDRIAPNLALNGNFDSWQRGTSFTSTSSPANNDDTYLVDLWTLLSDGNDRVDVTQEASVIPSGSRYAVKLDVETVGSPSQKFGLLHMLEAADVVALRGRSLSLSFQARTTGGAVRNLRAGILAWTGAADAPTSDVVSAWGAEGANPTLVANWAFENTPANLVLSNAFQTFKIENVAFDTAGANNLGIFIWADDTDLVAGDLVYLSQVLLTVGQQAGEYPPETFSETVERVGRFLEIWNNDAVASAPLAMGQARSATNIIGLLRYRHRKRVAPTVTRSAAADFDVSVATGADQNLTALVFGTITSESCYWQGTTAAGMAAGDATMLWDVGTGAARITISAEL